jgi:hypothetical protein
LDVSRVEVGKNEAKFGKQPGVIDAIAGGGMLFEFAYCLPELSRRAIRVLVAEMIQTDGRLDESLEENPGRALGLAPEVLPYLVSFEILSRVEKNYSVLEQITHWRPMLK